MSPVGFGLFVDDDEEELVDVVDGGDVEVGDTAGVYGSSATITLFTWSIFLKLYNFGPFLNVGPK